MDTIQQCVFIIYFKNNEEEIKRCINEIQSHRNFIFLYLIQILLCNFGTPFTH